MVIINLYLKAKRGKIALFDNVSGSQIRDSFGNHWLECKICGKTNVTE